MSVQSTPAGTIAWPQGGFQWNDALREQLPVVRGIRVPPSRHRGADQGAPVTLKLVNHQFNRFTEMAAAAGHGWTYWGEHSPQHITHEALLRRDADAWLELMAQTHCSSKTDGSWARERCLAMHGLPFAMEVLFAFSDLLKIMHWSDEEILLELRLAVAGSDAASYEAARNAASVLRERRPQWKLMCTYLFPEIGDWAVEAMELALADRSGLSLELLRDCVVPPELYGRYLKLWSPYGWARLLPGLLLQIHLHGEAACPAFAVVLSRLKYENKKLTAEFLKFVSQMQSPQLVPLLAADLDNKEFRQALERVAANYPAAVLKCAIESFRITRDRNVDAWLIRLALRHGEALECALVVVDEASGQHFKRILESVKPPEQPAGADVFPQASSDGPLNLPTVLSNPPWLAKARQQPLPVLTMPAIATPERIVFSVQALARAKGYETPTWYHAKTPGESFPEGLVLTPSGKQRLLRGEPLERGDVGTPPWTSAGADHVLGSPHSTQLLLWNSYPATSWSSSGVGGAAMRKLLADFDVAALPGFFAIVTSHTAEALAVGIHVDSPRLVEPVLHAFFRTKLHKAAANAWMRAYPRTVTFHALWQAFQAGPSQARDIARSGLRWLCANGFDAVTRDAAQTYGDTMSAALTALLNVDPLLILPSRMPKMPDFFVAASFHRPTLCSGKALPLASVEHIASMLAISKLDAPYAGLDVVKKVCDRASLARFVWEVFAAWLSSGTPAKDNWAFTALAHLGDDETARQLAQRIREWPGQSANARAVAGLDVLAGMGTDAALMHLHGMATKLKYKPLQARAKVKITEIADARGLSSEELADRLVPTLGLDEAGALELNFGARKFFVRFDESLKPFVTDAQGARLKDLPKPNSSDTAWQAESATQRFKQIKKNAKTIAALQVMRLEMAMVAQRRWSAASFRMCFIEHPVMRHLAARLVWGTYVDGQLDASFRVAEDLTLADANDHLFELGQDATVGIPHALEMTKESVTAFSQIFTDYEILQPFKQLGREVYALSDAEKQAGVLTRFQNRVYATASVFGLSSRGWDSVSYGGGWLSEYSRTLGEDFAVAIQLDPGTVMGDPTNEPKQKISAVTLSRRNGNIADDPTRFGQVNPILASEVLRDIELLALAKT